jgi:hypothetical protein
MHAYRNNILTNNEKEQMNFLCLSIYFYLKNRGYFSTANYLLNETELRNKIYFIEEFKQPLTEEEKLKQDFIQFFLKNSFSFKDAKSNDLLSNFWDTFWELFDRKIKDSSTKPSPIDAYLSIHPGNLTQTCKIFILSLLTYIDSQHGEQHNKFNI